MDYKPLTTADIPVVRPYFAKLGANTCDYTVGGMFMWRDFYRVEFSIQDETFYSRLYSEDGNVYYNIPIADDLSAALRRLIRDTPGPIRFCTVPEPFLPLFHGLDRACTVTEQTDYGDYFYQARDLAELKGRKYSGQRNQISQFQRHVLDWSYSDITPENLGEVRAFFQEHYLTTAGAGIYETEENAKVLEVLDQYDVYGMMGGVLRADGAVVGFSLSEIVGDTLFTHVEKALKTVKGGYQMLVNQSLKRFVTEQVRYVNREEDMGDAGLRTSKLSYHPIAVLKKYIVELG